MNAQQAFTVGQALLLCSVQPRVINYGMWVCGKKKKTTFLRCRLTQSAGIRSNGWSIFPGFSVNWLA